MKLWEGKRESQRREGVAGRESDRDGMKVVLDYPWSYSFIHCIVKKDAIYELKNKKNHKRLFNQIIYFRSDVWCLMTLELHIILKLDTF